MFLYSDKALEQTTKAVKDAEERFGGSTCFSWLSWPQTWGNTACGFGGIAGQAFTDAQTVIASGDTDSVFVYHAGRFAYEVKFPTEKFWQKCGERQLPGAGNWPSVAHEYDSSAEKKKK